MLRDIFVNILMIAWLAVQAHLALSQTSTVLISVDSTVKLSCVSPLAFNITESDISAAFAGGLANNSGIALSAGTRTTSLSGGSSLVVLMPTIVEPLPGNLASYNLTTDGCVVEATPPIFGSVSVRVVLTGNTVLQGSNGSEIRVNSVRGCRSGSGSAFAANFTCPRWYHYFGARALEFQINVDLSEATSSGLHSSVADGTFTVEVTTP
jgi:hypothetical protein